METSKTKTLMTTTKREEGEEEDYDDEEVVQLEEEKHFLRNEIFKNFLRDRRIALLYTTV